MQTNCPHKWSVFLEGRHLGNFIFFFYISETGIKKSESLKILYVTNAMRAKSKVYCPPSQGSAYTYVNVRAAAANLGPGIF